MVDGEYPDQSSHHFLVTVTADALQVLGVVIDGGGQAGVPPTPQAGPQPELVSGEGPFNSHL